MLLNILGSLLGGALTLFLMFLIGFGLAEGIMFVSTWVRTYRDIKRLRLKSSESDAVKKAAITNYIEKKTREENREKEKAQKDFDKKIQKFSGMVAEQQNKHLEMYAAMYLKCTQLPPDKVELVQQVTADKIVWFFRERETSN